MFLPTSLTTTEQADLQRLIDDGVEEGPHIDFKRDLPTSWTDAMKQEFLADVTAFANAGGGDLIFGLAEDNEARASALAPQSLDYPDGEALRLQEFLTSLVEPKMPGVQIQPVRLNVNGQAGFAIVARVPASWVGPHRLKMKSCQHFYVREGRRKRQLDIQEVRGLFLRSDGQAQRVRDFRTERLGKILIRETPYQLVDGAVLVLHVIPVQAAFGALAVDPTVYSGYRRPIPVLGATGSGSAECKVNLDGVVGARPVQAAGTHGYTVLFRNGFIETTYALSSDGGAKTPTLPGGTFESQIAQFLAAAWGEMDLWGATSREVLVMVSILGADKVRLGIHLAYHQPEIGYFDRRVVVIPDVELPGNEAPFEQLRPLFDVVWQSAGFDRSPNYDAAGKWAPAT